ncbi:Mitochondrial ornithine carrier protein [Lachancea thermotolerans]|uniref:KLTH0F15400p n=1 Tax=Lachancea thermotolerans (strain ATCC 56472 / CBS 6340 / NRRL Y-8284) TaxID=559295 RepID=C5DJC8_LACTC|nr:KLTH0F15400p [Lachancea thermotolerans CBS 6340]CAR24417.1 KLTH0F15400p [Lachancea thermotolerans CBS 6340]
MDIQEALKDILYGSIAGAAGKVIEYPLDTIKVRLQTQPAHLFPTSWSCIKYTYANEGFLKGFYQGVSSPLVGAALENAVLFVTFNRAQNFLKQYESLSPLSLTVWSGAFAGACTSYVLTPVELVKCTLQVSNLKNSKTSHSKVWPTVKHIVSQNGISGLWRGQSSTFIRECAGGAVWFTTYESVKQYLANKRNDTENQTWELLTAGASAGVAFNASVFPADTIKSTAQTEHLGIVNATKRILARNGPAGLYRGLGITLIRAAPANAVVFYTYETLSNL